MRLNQGMREHVLTMAIHAVFDETEIQLKQELANAVVKELMINGVQLAKDIPAGWEKYIRQTSSLTVYKPDDYGVHVDFPVSLCVPGWGSLELSRAFRESNPAMLNYFALRDETEAYRKDVKALLNVCTTTAELEALSPELAAYLPKNGAPANAIVPVELLNRVRARLTKV